MGENFFSLASFGIKLIPTFITVHVFFEYESYPEKIFKWLN